MKQSFYFILLKLSVRGCVGWTNRSRVKTTNSNKLFLFDLICNDSHFLSNIVATLLLRNRSRRWIRNVCYFNVHISVSVEFISSSLSLHILSLLHTKLHSVASCRGCNCDDIMGFSIHSQDLYSAEQGVVQCEWERRKITFYFYSTHSSDGCPTVPKSTFELISHSV